MPPGPASLPEDFRDCIDSLNAHGVCCVLVGGYALGWHGVVRATGDIDFLYQQTTDNVARLCAALADFGAPDTLIDAAFLMSPNAVTQFGRAPLRIDLLAAISGISFEAVFASAVAVELDGQRLLIIGREALLQNKRATGRARDRDDLRRLESIRGAPGRPAGKRSSRKKTHKPPAKRRGR